MATYEVSGAWVDKELKRYCSPGSWVSGLSTDSYDGGSVYAEYQAVAAIFDLDANSLSEISLSDDPIRNADLDGTNTLSALGYADGVEEKFALYPLRLAGYQRFSDADHRVYLHYIRDDETDQLSVLHSLSGDSLLETQEDLLTEPGPLATFAGGFACVDSGEIEHVT